MDNTLSTLQEIDIIEIAKSQESSMENFSKEINVQSTDLTIISQNIRSIYSNISDLQITLSSLHSVIDLLVLTECRLHPNKPIPQMPNYMSYLTTNHINRCDGVVFYIEKSHNVIVREIKLSHASCLQVSMHNLIILGIYRSPSNSNATSFINSLNCHLESIKSCSNIIIAGDININIIPKINESCSERINRYNYLNMLALHGLLPGHTLPTRDHNCLDHFMLKIKRNKISAHITVIHTTITDHYMIFLKLSRVKNITTIIPKIKTKINFEKALNSINKYKLTELLSCDDPQTLSEQFLKCLGDCLLQNTVISLVPRSQRIIKPWITLGILRCIKNRNNMQKKLRSEPENQILKITYRRYRNHCNNLIKKLKRKYDREQLNNACKNPKKLWSTINSITHRKTKKPQCLELLNVEKLPENSVNSINNYFANIGKTLADAMVSSSSPQQTHIITQNMQSSSFVLVDTDYREVYSILTQLKTDSAPGYDNIPTKFLKLGAEFVVPVIAHLANLCFKHGKFPPSLKQAIVTPVYKSGSRDEPSNYRPISVLPAISKIVEKLINNRLLNYIDKYDILSDSQYGFRRKRSTEDAVTALTSLIVKQIDTNKKCLTVFLDIKKAFDTISAKTLVSRLEGIGIRGVPLALLTDYLKERTQRTRIGHYTSDKVTISFGVPQGSVLGPTLFLLYINSLCDMDNIEGQIFSYADDTAIVFTGVTWAAVKKTAEKGLSKIAAWLSTNLLTLNITKTNYITFSKYITTQPSTDFHIKIHTCNTNTHTNCLCNIITKVTSAKYLGVMIDQRLSWHSHLEMMISRTRKLIWTFKTLRHVASTILLNKIYISLVQSILTYCISVWGGATKTKLLELERVQRSLIKVMYFKPYSFPTSELYSNSKLLSIRKLYILQAVLKLHKSMSYNPDVLNRRQRRNVVPLIKVKSSFAKRQFDRQSAHLYNIINKEINIYHKNYHLCKKELQTWLKTKNYDEIEDLLNTIA